MRRVVGRCGVVCLAVWIAVGGGALAAGSLPTGRVAGRVFSVAGTSWAGPRDERGLATATPDLAPFSVTAATDEAFLFGWYESAQRVGADGRIATAAGPGGGGFSGDGGPATAAQIGFPAALAALPDGGFLIADYQNHRVRRVWPDAHIDTVAGNGAAGAAGDGGAATAAQVGQTAALAALPDGGLMIAGEHRVRRVWADGHISTVAGTGTPGYSGDGGPATTAQLDEPEALAILPDGGFMVADRGLFDTRLRRVGPDGTISTVVARTGDDFDALAVTADGSLLTGGGPIEGGGVIRRVAADGRMTVIAGDPEDRVTSGDGGPASHARFDALVDLAGLPDGSLLFSDGNRVRLMVGPHGTAILAAAIRPQLGRASAHGYRLRYVLTAPARVTVRIFGSPNARPSATAHVTGRPGEASVNVVRGPARLAGVYAIDLRADAGGRAARAVEYADLGGRLTKTLVKALADVTPGEEELGEAAAACHRFSGDRIDCVIVLPRPGDDKDCRWVSSYRLAPSGQVTSRRYECPTRRSSAVFQRHPRWTWPAQREYLSGVWLRGR